GRAAAGAPGGTLQESLDILLRIWNGPFEPWTIQGRFWTVRNPEPFLRYGPHLRPYQRPHPPLALAGLSPNSATLELAGARGLLPLSLTFNTPYLEGHWAAVERGAAGARRRRDRGHRRLRP